MTFKILAEVDGSQPLAAMAVSDLHSEIKCLVEKHGKDNVATLGQVHTWDGGLIMIEGGIFTGEAAEYLQEQIKIAAVMQKTSALQLQEPS
jgi:hypothetical protein